MTLGNQCVSGFAILAGLAACTLANPGYGDSAMVTASATDSATDSVSASATTSASTSGSGSDSSAETSTTSTASATSTDETSSDTGSSSGSTTSGDTNDDTSSDTNGDTSNDTNGTCGDGIKQDDEECEYTDPNDLGGCSENCHIKPTGIELVGEKKWTSWAFQEPLSQPGEGDCDSGVMVRFSAYNELNLPKVPCSPSFGCSALSIDADLSVNTAEDYASNEADNCSTKGANWEQICPKYHVITGLRASGFPLDIYQLEFRCTKVSINESPDDGFSITVDEPTIQLGPHGSDDWTPNHKTIDCPANSAAIGVAIQDLSIKDIRAIRLECRELKLVFP
ncbi:MAG TPA: hypothetical protein ENJ18_04740 [Nannocystis exedens]|nr:hypothetical protein [Nannocystis exedens]